MVNRLLFIGRVLVPAGCCVWLVGVIVAVLGACSKTPTYEECVSRTLSTTFPADSLRQYQYVVLIPGAGCVGCITEAENFFTTHAHDRSTLFIFTRVLSVKKMGIKMGRENLSLPNVYIDKDNQFYFEQYDKCIYPCLIYLEDGRPERFANLDERM